jgi:hypothetical protein
LSMHGSIRVDCRSHQIILSACGTVLSMGIVRPHPVGSSQQVPGLSCRTVRSCTSGRDSSGSRRPLFSPCILERCYLCCNTFSSHPRPRLSQSQTASPRLSTPTSACYTSNPPPRLPQPSSVLHAVHASQSPSSSLELRVSHPGYSSLRLTQ